MLESLDRSIYPPESRNPVIDRSSFQFAVRGIQGKLCASICWSRRWMLCQLQGRLLVVLVSVTRSSEGNGSPWNHWSVNPISCHWTSNLTSDGQYFDLFCSNISVVLIRQDPKHETMRERAVGVSFDQETLLVRHTEERTLYQRSVHVDRECRFWTGSAVRCRIGDCKDDQSVFDLAAAADSLFLTCQLTISRQESMKKKTIAGATRSNLSLFMK